MAEAAKKKKPRSTDSQLYKRDRYAWAVGRGPDHPRDLRLCRLNAVGRSPQTV